MGANEPKYKLLGSDQKEYGPVNTDQFRTWIAQGRANARSKVQAAGSRGWKVLTEFPEFAEALQRAGGRRAAADRSKGKAAATPSQRCALALPSLVLGCLGLVTCGITSLVGLVLGIIALVRINKSQGRLAGRELAMAGIVVSAVLMLVAPIVTSLVARAVTISKVKSVSVVCMSNIKQLNLALIMYADDNKDRFPAGTNWCDAIMPYVGGMTNALICPKGAANQRCHYALNAQLAGRALEDIHTPRQELVLVFECDGGWNVSGGRELLPAKPRHDGAYTVGFADGHVEMRKSHRLERLRWEP